MMMINRVCMCDVLGHPSYLNYLSLLLSPSRHHCGSLTRSINQSHHIITASNGVGIISQFRRKEGNKAN